MVGDVGLEPTHPEVGVFETPLSAYSNNPPYSHLGAVAFGPYRQSHRRYLVTTRRLVFLLKLRESQSHILFLWLPYITNHIIILLYYHHH